MFIVNFNVNKNYILQIFRTEIIKYKNVLHKYSFER